MSDAGRLYPIPDSKIERPIAVTVICILGFVGAGLSVPMAFSDVAKQIGSWFPPYSSSIAAMSLICMIGFWFTKRWAIYAYIGLVVLNQIVLIYMDEWHILTLVFQGIIVAVILLNLEPKAKMFSHLLIQYVRRQVWAIIVAYMVGIHNFYREENKAPEDIVFTVEHIEEQEDDTPKDEKPTNLPNVNKKKQ
ncbi:MAG: hypothetical protein WBA23_17635 [Tunicatimonas sp.]|uniref:hypothetical protein n=1 Tax=Tunicatimonas sp. TaxID=1940096 RepID=UPI003C7455F2